MVSRLLFLIVICFQFVNGAQGQYIWPAGVVGNLQHTGAIHVYAETGDLEISVYKRDLKTNVPIDRTAVIYLTGPDGSVHAMEKILSPPGKWDGKEGPLQKVVLRAKVIYPGVYTLLIACNDDPYLRKNQLWGFATNAKKYLLNTGAGHLDSERMEPISLLGGNTPFSVFFKPEQESFKILLSQLPLVTCNIELRNPKDELVWEAKANEGKLTSPDISNKMQGIWELRLSVSKANILIEGLNYKFKPNTPILPIWATSRSSYFDLGQVHWLLQPRRIAKNLQPGAKGTIDFSVFNNYAKSAKYKLITHLPANFPGKVRLKKDVLTIAEGGLEKIALSYELHNTLADGIYSFTISCKNEITGAQTFSLVELRVNKSHANKALELPIQFKIFEHDQFQFAYEPGYPTENEFYFDKDNRPWVITTEGVKTLIKKQWQTVKIPGYEEKDIRFPSSTLATDADGNVYAIAYLAKKPHLIKASAKNLYADKVELPVRGSYSLETNPGRNDSTYPPGILSYTANKHSQRIGRWSTSQDVNLILIETIKGKLSLSHTIPVTKNGIGVSLHSGVPNTIVSDEKTVHIVWGETSDPKLKYPGVPIYTASFDRTTSKLIDSTFVGYAPPVNDVHNTSSILMDNSNKPQIIIASHNRPFFHRYATNDIKKWSEPQQVSTFDQTYVGAVFDQDNTIHLFYRVWERGKAFPGKFQASMYYQTKTKKGEWSQPKLFALPALPAYSVYRHRVTVDKLGNLFLNIEYWSTWTAYRDMLSLNSSLNPKKNNRISLISKDKGLTWKVLTDQDLEKSILTVQNKGKSKLIVLDPVHPHSAQIQQSLKQHVEPDVYLYAPDEEDLKDNYLNLVQKNNLSDTNNNPWKVNSYIGADFLDQLIKDKKGSTVILASNNAKKAKYSLALAKVGFNILVDKPMAISPNDFKDLSSAFQFAATNKRYITDIPAMTMRSQIICNLQKELSSIPEIYGKQERGTFENPAIIQENVHHYLKKVLRPTYFFDVSQQGLGVAEVTTHLIDLVQWTSFSKTPINYSKDIEVLSSKVWATKLTPTQFKRVTSHNDYPEFLKKNLQDSILHVFSNGEINYTLKNIYIQIISKWDYQAKPGTGDTHRSVMKGSKSTLMIKSGKPQDLYIEPKPGTDLKALETSLLAQVERLRKKYTSLELVKEEKGWRIHSVIRSLNYTNDLAAPSNWDVAGMLAKYYTTTQAVLKVKYVK